MSAPTASTLAHVLDAMPEAEYHAHPALSSSGARKLLSPSCPARFQWERANPPLSKPNLDFGSAAHRNLLGVGAELVVVDADDWRTKAAQEQRDEARAAGHTPVLRDDMLQIEAMAAALRAHPVAAALFNPERGRPEQSLFWSDERTSVECRARLDWLPDAHAGRMIVPDYKTTQSAEPEAFAKSCATYGYHQQAAWYIDAVRACDLADDVAFIFVAQEKTAPYLVTVCELDSEALRLGAHRNQLAREVFADCTATNTWPSYTDEVAHLSLPGWYLRQHDDLEIA
jgi:hypothetical protein